MRKLKRSLALLVALVMCLSLLPANRVFAVEEEGAAGNYGETVNYFGVLADTWCAPFDGEPRVESPGTINFTTPSANDWYSLTMVINGNSRTFARFGGSCMERVGVGASGLSTVVLPESVEEVRNYAFKNCVSLVEINLEKVAYIREGAFYGCSSFVVGELADDVVIEDWAFTKVLGFGG